MPGLRPRSRPPARRRKERPFTQAVVCHSNYDGSNVSRLSIASAGRPSVKLRRIKIQFGAPDHPYRHWGFDMEIPLRKRDLDPVGMKLVPHSQQHIASDIPDSVFWIVDPKTEFEFDRTIAESPEQAHGLR